MSPSLTFPIRDHFTCVASLEQQPLWCRSLRDTLKLYFKQEATTSTNHRWPHGHEGENPREIENSWNRSTRKEDRKNSRIEYNVTTFALPTKMSTDTSEPTSESWKQCSGFNKEGSTFPNERVLAGVYQNFICFSLTGVPLWLGFSRQRTLLLLLWVWNNSHPLVLEHEGHTHRSIWKETK